MERDESDGGDGPRGSGSRRSRRVSSMSLTVDPTTTQTRPTEPASASATAWPAEVELVVSALEAAAGGRHDERRRQPRTPYRVAAELRLFSDAADAPPWVLYTRDVST